MRRSLKRAITRLRTSHEHKELWKLKKLTKNLFKMGSIADDVIDFAVKVGILEQSKVTPAGLRLSGVNHALKNFISWKQSIKPIR